jgi:hypothetical protein
VDSREIVTCVESGVPRSRVLKLRCFTRRVTRKTRNIGFSGLTQSRQDAKVLSSFASWRLCVRTTTVEIPMFSVAPSGIAQLQNSRVVKSRCFSRQVVERSQDTGYRGLTRRRADAKELFFSASPRLCVRTKPPKTPMFSAAPPGIAQRQIA